MSHADFVHLRVRSAFSLLQSTVRVEALAKACKAARMPAVAVTDDANLFGAMQFCAAAEKAGVQPIVGALLAMAPLEALPRTPGRQPAPEQVVLLVKDAEGYANLLRLMSRAYAGAEAGGEIRITRDDLAGHQGGLICLTGGPGGPVGAALRRGDAKLALRTLLELKAIFGDRLYVELMRHGIADADVIEPALLDLAYAHDLPLVATNDVHFLDAEGYEAHDALICIAEGAQVALEERRRLTVEHRFKTAAEMATLFADVPEAVANTLVIARRCAFMAPTRQPILPTFAQDEAAEMRRQAAEGLERRLAQAVWAPGMDAAEREAAARPYRERLAYELDVIAQMKFPGYFLIVSDFIKWAKAAGVPVGPGRGSGAGSVVAWSLDITDLDPLRFGLLFERFLNPERVSMPDFDIDFCEDRRHEVIIYVRDRFGADRVAQIITFGTLQARAALRDVGRVLGLPFGLVDRTCKLVPNNPANPVTLAQAIELEPRLKEARDEDPSVARMIKIALQLEGLPRNASTHAAGVVIGDRPLEELVPLYRDPRAPMPATQFNMKDVEKAGLVKFDFLGLSTLTMLVQAEQLVNERGTPLVLATLPLDDMPTYELLSRAETQGRVPAGIVGNAGRAAQAQARLLRGHRGDERALPPGPDGQHPALHQRQARSRRPELSAPDAGADPQGDQRRHHLPGAGDGDRQATGRVYARRRRSAAARHGQEDQVGNGRAARDVHRRRDRAQDQAGSRQHHLRRGGEVRLLWLRQEPRHRLRAARLPDRLSQGEPPGRVLRGRDDHGAGQPGEARRLLQRDAPAGHPGLSAGRQRSKARFLVEDGPAGAGVRYALAAIKGVGEAAMTALVEERAARGPYRDVYDLMARLGTKVLNKRLLESLIRAGALDFAGRQPAAAGRGGRAAAPLCRGVGRGRRKLAGQPVRGQRPGAGAAADAPGLRGLAGARAAADGVRRAWASISRRTRSTATGGAGAPGRDHRRPAAPGRPPRAGGCAWPGSSPASRSGSPSAPASSA